MFCQGYIPSVVRRDVRAQLPGTRAEGFEGEELHPERKQISEREGGHIFGELAGMYRAPHDVRDLREHEVGRGKMVIDQLRLRPATIGPRCLPMPRPQQKRPRRGSPPVLIPMTQDPFGGQGAASARLARPHSLDEHRCTRATSQLDQLGAQMLL